MQHFLYLSLSIFMLSMVVPCWGQNPILDLDGHADCTKRLMIETKKTIGPTTAPNSYGELQEFSNNPKHNVHFMEDENHSVWYQFIAKTSGTLSFEIAPLDSLNDYDFSLYHYTEDNFCEAVFNKTLLPVRTNFSRNKTTIGGRTGLHKGATEAYVGEGINAAYSSVLPVKKGDTLVLLVNNVYDNGKGHTLHFDYVSNRRLSTAPLPEKKKAKEHKIDDDILIRWGGKVQDIDNNSMIGDARVILKDLEKEIIVAEGISDVATGRYYFMFLTKEDALQSPLYLEAFRKGYWFKNQYLNPYEVTNALEHKPMTIQLQKLKKGMHLKEFTLLFAMDSSEPMTRSKPTVNALLKVMRANPSLKIKLTGHTNGCAAEGSMPGDRIFDGEIDAQALSLKRAKKIKTILEQEGIISSRVEIEGKGCTELLYGIKSKEAHLNTRMEIEILDY